MGRDDKRGEEVEDSIDKESEEDVEEDSAVDVGSQVHLWLQQDIGVVNIISI